jgi:xanthine phosphoribosyltransferase
MEKLKQRIREEGKIRGTNEILKVDSFLNHQVDAAFLTELGQAFRDRFAGCQVDKILTIETSGIGIAVAAAPAFGNVPVLFAKKNKTKNIAGDVYISQAESFTQDRRPYNIFVSKEFLKPGEKVLLMDDFLANGSALAALIDIAQQAGAEIVGAAIVIEKAFQPGGQLIRDKGVRVESLAKIAEMSEEKGVVFADD